MSDRRAVILLVALGAAGAVVRLLGHSEGAPGSVAYRAPVSPRSSLDSVAARASRLARPLRRGDRIDLDAASREEIERLPRIGPGLAARIISDREENGPFGSLEGLDRVSGVGPTLLKAIEPYATVSGRMGGSADGRTKKARFPGSGGILRSDEPSIRPSEHPPKRRTKKKL